MTRTKSHKIRIHKSGTGRITDREAAASLKSDAPEAFQKAQQVLAAAAKYVNNSGLFSTESSRLRKLQSRCYDLSKAIRRDGFMSDKIEQEGELYVVIEFMSLVSDAFPNWQPEYEALNKLLPLIF